MMLPAMFLTSLFVILGVASGQLIRRSCPDVDTKSDFNITRYLGDWYEDRKFFAIFEFGLTCVRANYQLLMSDTIQVTNYGTRRFFGTETYAKAIAKVSDPSEPGRLSINFNPDSDSPTGFYLVLDTDYDNYALVYSCSDYFGLFSAEIAWILKRRRSYQLPAAKVGDLYAKLQTNDINPNRFTRVFEPNCPGK